MVEVQIGLLAAERGKMRRDAETLFERKEPVEVDDFFKRRLSDQGGCEAVGGVEAGVVDESDFVEDVGFKQMRLIDNDDGVDLLLVEEFGNGAQGLRSNVGPSELWDKPEL